MRKRRMIPASVFLSLQIRSIKPRVQNVLDTLETVTNKYRFYSHSVTISLRERCKIKTSKKKLTTVSFTFTHTYTLKKLTLTFFPQAYIENFQMVSHQKIGDFLCEAATSINSCLMEGFKEKSERAVCRILQTGSFL